MKCKALKPGKQVHALLLLTNISFNSKLVGMYASCGNVKSARLVFDEIPNPNVFAVNWMVLASAYNGDFEEAIGYFSLMRDSMKSCNKFTFSIVLKTCVGLLDLKKGKQIHSIVNKMGFDSDVSVGKIEQAMVLFERLGLEGLEPNDFTWNAMIAGYARRGDTNGAFEIFSRMSAHDGSKVEEQEESKDV
ncbi:hypothetical protein QYF36_011526 [Acer negundo]|nr:hypothetical protein QYF36_011526 [Acer negundo]